MLARTSVLQGGFLAAALVLATGCDERQVQVEARQPLEFAHARHVSYFASGRHRAEKIAMHLKILDLTEPPEELAQGRCAECHDDLAQRKACATCHVLFQDAALRGDKALRRCVACHRGAWNGNAATLPTNETCVACHTEGMPALVARTRGPHVQLARAGDGPPPDEELRWVQLDTVPPNVYFSHSAHVRFASVACTRCHQDVSTLAEPPSSVRVLSMSECLRCHAENGASTDCLTCHK